MYCNLKCIIYSFQSFKPWWHCCAGSGILASEPHSACTCEEQQQPDSVKVNTEHSQCFFISNSCDFLERKEKLLEILTHLNEKCLIQVIIASNGQVTRTQNPPDQKKLRELRTLKQHYYPEGGWGWVVLLVAFLVHSLVLGTQTVLASIVISFGKPNSIARKLQPAVFSSASK